MLPQSVGIPSPLSLLCLCYTLSIYNDVGVETSEDDFFEDVALHKWYELEAWYCATPANV